MALPRPICVSCKREMRCAKNEFLVRGKRTETSPATVWSGDKFRCPGCEAEIVVGFGKGRVETNVYGADQAMEFKRN
jgi:predicted RNA-binding Zn-ribbon protein involved in translation (DUF1610 family)